MDVTFFGPPDYIDNLWLQQSGKNAVTSYVRIAATFFAPPFGPIFGAVMGGLSALSFYSLVSSAYEPLHLIHKTLRSLGDAGIYVEEATVANMTKLAAKLVAFQMHPEEYIAQLRVAVVAARKGDFDGSKIAIQHLVQTLKDDYGDLIR